MENIKKGLIYIILLATGFFIYFVEIMKVKGPEALILSLLSFIVLMVVYLMGRKTEENQGKKIVILVGLSTLFALALSTFSVPLAVNTWIIFTLGSLSMVYREKLLPSMPAFIYGLVGASIGFIISLIVLPETNLGDIPSAIALIALMIVFLVLFIVLGRRVKYRPFNRYPLH